MFRWIKNNGFWILSAVSALLAAIALYHDNLALALTLAAMSMLMLIFGISDSNVRFSKGVIEEYDRLVRVQRSRKRLRLVKGGKSK